MTQRWFLELDGIPGDSTDAAHKDWIDVQSWAWGVAANTGNVTGGVRVGRPTLEPLSVAAHLGSASPRLFEACVTGRHISDAVLSGVTASGSGKGFEFLTVRLQEVTVAAQHLGDSLGVAPSDEFTLTYGRVEISFRRQTATGGAGVPVTASYDARAARA